jgi:hypothetical protein
VEYVCWYRIPIFGTRRATIEKMDLPPEITFEDFRNVVEMLKTAIQGMSDLADRVRALEQANDAHLEAAIALKGSQMKLFEAQKAQQDVNILMKESLDTLLRSIGHRATIQ